MPSRAFQTAFSSLLESHEEFVWNGQPVPRYAVWRGFPGDTWPTRFGYLFIALLGILPFSLGGFYLTWTATQSLAAVHGIDSGAGVALMLLLGLVLGLGPWFPLLTPPLRNYRNARSLHYVITNRRAMILQVRKQQVVKEHVKYLRDIFPPRLKLVGNNKIGDVIYDVGGDFHAADAGIGFPMHYDIGFEGVRHARRVLKKLQQARRNALPHLSSSPCSTTTSPASRSEYKRPPRGPRPLPTT